MGEGIPEKCGSDITRPFQGLKRESIRYLGTEKLAGQEVYLFEATPSDTKGMEQTQFTPSRVKLWVGTDNGVLFKMAAYDRQGQEMLSQSFSAIELDVSVADSLFVFTPPEGIQVVDMTEATVNTLKSMKCQKQRGRCGIAE